MNHTCLGEPPEMIDSFVFRSGHRDIVKSIELVAAHAKELGLVLPDVSTLSVELSSEAQHAAVIAALKYPELQYLKKAMNKCVWRWSW
jgi:hypothetical protein